MLDSRKKILSPAGARKIGRLFRKRKLVFTNGTFDILHAGHVSYLEKARRLGAALIVAVNSDKSVKKYKGPGRPLNPLADRLRVLAALECVDYVVAFGDETPLKVIKRVRPRILVKGGDWKKNQIVGAREVESWGGRVVRMPVLTGRSSTRLIEALKRL